MLLQRSQRSARSAGSISVSITCRQRPAGQVAPLVCCIIAVLLGSVALGTDVAVHYYTWLRMQEAADAGVIAGANALPDDPGRAITIAKQFAEANGVAEAEITSTTVAPDDQSITMVVRRTVPYYFAQVLGMTNATMQVSAAAALPSGSSGGGPNGGSLPNGGPLCVGCANPPPAAGTSPPSGFPNPPPASAPAACVNTGDCQLIPIGLDHNTKYVNGDPITLQQGEVGLSGNWDLLALGGVGGNNLRGNIADGYSGLVTVGDLVVTEPGQKVGPVNQGFQDRMNAAESMDPTGTASSHILTNPRVLVLPVVTWTGKNGRGQVPVDAFATVWLDGYGTGSHRGEVYVHFISQVIGNSAGSGSAPNFGGHGHPILIQ